MSKTLYLNSNYWVFVCCLCVCYMCACFYQVFQGTPPMNLKFILHGLLSTRDSPTSDVQYWCYRHTELCLAFIQKLEIKIEFLVLLLFILFRLVSSIFSFEFCFYFIFLRWGLYTPGFPRPLCRPGWP